MPHTILVADDSVTIQKAIEIVFAQEPAFTLVAVTNGDEALARARELQPAIVLADHQMAGRSGYEVAEALRAEPTTASIPVVLMQGGTAPVDAARLQACGAIHLKKPFDSQALLDCVLSAVGEATLADPLGGQQPALQPAGSPSPSAIAPPSAPAPTSPAPPATANLPRPPSAPAGGAPAGQPPGVSAPFAAAPSASAPTQAPSELGFATSSDEVELEFDLVDTEEPIVTAASQAVAAAAPAPAAPAVQPAPAAVAAVTEAIAPAVVDVAEAQVRDAVTDAAAPSREALTAATREIIERAVWEVVPELAETLIREEIARLLREKAG